MDSSEPPKDQENNGNATSEAVKDSPPLEKEDNASRNDEEDSDSGEEVYTFEELDDLDKEAHAVLGASDPDNCSYPQGYMTRQALYACLTCNNPKDPDAERAGVCLACSNACHDGHKLVELYTKRKFRCDCGNSKFRGGACQLLPNKEAKNVGNIYNHNYDGRYCTCSRPYPDTEVPENNTEMIQCIVCEDWFHDKHAFGLPTNELVFGDGEEEDTEMICAPCAKSCEFLQYYTNLRLTMTPKQLTPKKAAGDGNKSNDDDQILTVDDADSSDSKTSELQVETLKNTIGSQNNVGIVKETLDSKLIESECPATTDSSSKEHCLISNKAKVELPECATLWIPDWRKQLCRCNACTDMYYKLGVSFLLDENDTLDAYEALGKAKIEQEEKDSNEEIEKMWNKLDHVAKVEALIGFNEIKQQLTNFMMKHKGKVVRRRDVEEFAEELASKRAKRSSELEHIPPGNCR